MVSFGPVTKKQFKLIPTGEYVFTLDDVGTTEGDFGERMVWDFFVAEKETPTEYMKKDDGTVHTLKFWTDVEVTLGSRQLEWISALTGRTFNRSRALCATKARPGSAGDSSRPPSSPDKLTKVPYSVHGGLASSTDPKTWATFREALEYHLDNEWTDGVGMVVCDADDFVGIDLDHCLDAETGEIEPWARKVVETVDSYTEITPSNTGLRIFARGTLPPSGRKRGDFEIYENGRYLTVTGRHLEGTPLTVESRELEIRRVHREVWPDQGKPVADRPAPRPSTWPTAT
jgi:hypothetical protein